MLGEEGNKTNGLGRTTLQRMFDETRKRLVEIGTRNRLVHVNRANTRGNVLNIVNERSDDVYAILGGGKTMRFHALGHDRHGADEIVLAKEVEEPVSEDRYTDNLLDTRLGPDGLAKKLLKIAREAKTAEEEQGINILYLALGFATWFEDKTSNVAREAPLVLLPVELVRNERSSTYDVRVRDEDLVTNLPLQQRWAEDFGIKLPEVDADAEGWKPSRYHEQIEQLVIDRPGWKVDRNAIQLGFFSFSKLLMYRDLALDAWPEDALEKHDLTRGLLYEGFEQEAALFGADDRLDALFNPDQLFHVVDADASQAKVIEEVRSGRNLVVQGPPGTGKSQTITNIIAAAARDGKTVLFIAEKMAALSVVHDRLVKVGLGDLALELHSKSASKKLVLAELSRTLSAGQAVPAVPQSPEALRISRDRLNKIAGSLHQPVGETGETPFTLLGKQARYLGMGAPTPTLKAAALADMNREEEAKAGQAISNYGERLATAGPPAEHPFAGVAAIDLQPVTQARLKPELEATAEAAQTLRHLLERVMTAAGLNGPRSLAMADPLIDLLGRLDGLRADDALLAQRIGAASDSGRLVSLLTIATRWRDARDELSETFVEGAFTADIFPLRGPLAAGAASFFARWGSAYRSASRTLAGLLRGVLPKSAGERLALVDRLLDVQALRRDWSDDEPFAATILADAWRGERTDFARAVSVVAWCQRAMAGGHDVSSDRLVAMAANPQELADWSAALPISASAASTRIGQQIQAFQLDEHRVGSDRDRADLNGVAAVFSTMADAIDRYGEWASLVRARRELEAFNLSELADRMAAGQLDASAATIELKYARAEALWDLALAENPELAELARLDRHALVDGFATLERRWLKDNVTSILAGHLAQLPQGAMGEMKVLRGEIGKKRAHIALRKLFSLAPNAIQRIKPVLLMSPISVAQYLTRGLLEFDLLVIDEASQVRPEDALGAIARARQIAVVGDQKQLPPSSFFDRLLSDGDGAMDGEDDEDADVADDPLGGAAAVGELESILTLCEARGLPSRMLQWHYRSRDPSLMRVSNAEFYRHELVLPPSPLEKDRAFGLIFTRVDGVYDKGGKRDNRREGEAIVARVAEHARNSPNLSLGIVTFSHAQKNMVTELLDLARRSDPELDGFLREGRHEDLFVKNIENVQGDERDVILISVGYGPSVPGGRMIGASFGPVNGEGGERRLNVLFTRARLRCEVFASFDPEELDVSRASRDGPRVLKRFLDFAKSGQLDERAETGAPADSAFEEDVAEVIRSLGYLADPQVGSAGFRIDLGIRHPDRPGVYLLAVECDGATYHSALWARERDRLRQDVLEHLGWRFHRIWSTDWFYDRKRQIDRLRAALEAARNAEGSTMGGANNGGQAPPSRLVPEVPLQAPLPMHQVERTMPPYRRAHFPMHVDCEPHEAHVSILAPLAQRIVEAEGPICLDEVARRIAFCFGREKAGSRILSATRHALVRARKWSSELLMEDDFWFTAAQQADPPVRDRSAESGATLKADAISLLEIRAALALARADNAGGTDADLIRAAARLLGYRRVGSDLNARLAAGLQD